MSDHLLESLSLASILGEQRQEGPLVRTTAQRQPRNYITVKPKTVSHVAISPPGFPDLPVFHPGAPSQ